MSARALLFDLDDTLYPERRFMLSGFAAVAAVVSSQVHAPQRIVFEQLVGAARQGRRNTAFQEICETWHLDHTILPSLLATYRQHRPCLRLPRRARTVLGVVRESWRTAIVTNGPPDVQARKVSALGVSALVDAVILAESCGSGCGKPERAVFMHALEALDVDVADAVMVGDDPWCDVAGARAVGMRTIRMRRGRLREAADAPDAAPDAVVTTLSAVPQVAERLLQERLRDAD
jgi:putative hydrolase of the HAD superfamily